MSPTDWIVINYTLPREPSRVRVSLWRKLKKVGAINIQQSMWILPMTDEHYRLFSEIKDEISQNHGEAFVMKASLEEDGQKVIEKRFNSARDEEYGEFLEQCEDYFKEIDKEMKQWYSKIMARDTFGASLREASGTSLLKCAEMLDKFCDKVYEFANQKQGD